MNKLSYELAEKLKGAGFQFRDANRLDKPNIIEIDGYAYYLPTLSELIEACGDGVFYLGRNTKGEWVAEIGMLLEKETEFGSTPEEAVAALYLALHEGKTN